MTAGFALMPSFAKVILKPAFQGFRALPIHAELLRGGGYAAARKAVFLPAYGPNGAALLRIYKMASALRSLGWGCLVLPAHLTLAQRHRFLARARPDVVVMQGARHVLNQPALYPDWPVVFDMDDADFHLPHLAGPVARAMSDVAAVIAGSRYVADWCHNAGARAAHVVWTGTPVSTGARTAPHTRPPVVAWAQSRPMTYQGEAAFVACVMKALAVRRPGVTLRLYDRRPGDDPDFAKMFAAPGLRVEWCDAMSYRDYLASFDDVAVGLAPLSMDAPFVRGKSFGKVLAYLDRKVPVLAADAGEHGRFFEAGTGVVSNDVAVWEQSLLQLLDTGAARSAMADAAFEAFKTRLSLDAAARDTDRILRAVIRLNAESGSCAALCGAH